MKNPARRILENRVAKEPEVFRDQNLEESSHHPLHYEPEHMKASSRKHYPPYLGYSPLGAGGFVGEWLP